MDRRAIEQGIRIHSDRTTNTNTTTTDDRTADGGRRGAGSADLGMAAVRRAGGCLEGTGMCSRRTLLLRTASVGAAALAVGVLGAAAVRPAGASAGSAKATVALNLRSGPSTGHQVLRVIPAGGVVALQGDSRNGFNYVTYDGVTGWASAQFLGAVGGQTPPPGGGLGSNGRTTAAVNFREGPSTGARVIAVLPAGTPIFVHDQGASGFWSVAYNGRSGWIWAAYVERTGGGTPPPSGPVYNPNAATTTAALNLRAEPSTGAKVLLVMPAGAKVTLKSGTANGWRQVSYNGTTGWASTAYLN